MTWGFRAKFLPNCMDEPVNNLLEYTKTLNNDEYDRCGDKPRWFILKETRVEPLLV